MLEARDLLRSWKIVHPRGDNVHTFVRLRMTFASDSYLKDVGLLLDALTQARNRADYDLSPHPLFASAAFASQSVLDVAARLSLLDAVAADPARSAAAAADIRSRWP
jgi:hypothetical protein